MIQEILTYIIVFFAVAYTVNNFIKFIVPSKKNTIGHACSGSCKGCSVKSKLVEEIKVTKLN